MAHDLYIENDKARMMYVGEAPWHGMGTRLDKPATSAEAIKVAGLDWNVRKVPLYAIEGPGVVPVRRHFGIVPEDRWGKPDCPVFGVVSADYQPLQNAEAFTFFDSLVGEEIAMYHTAGALGRGERVWILAKLPGEMEITTSDFLEKFILLSTGHDGSSSVRVLLTPVRVVCQNTLTMALEEGDELARACHTRAMGRQLEEAGRRIRRLIKGFDSMQEAFRAMTRRKLKDTEAEAYIEGVFPTPRQSGPSDPPELLLRDRARCLELYRLGMGHDNPDIKETLWAAYNGIAEYVDHWRRRGNRGRLFTSCFGRGYQLKSRAYREALRLLGPVSVN